MYYCTITLTTFKYCYTIICGIIPHIIPIFKLIGLITLKFIDFVFFNVICAIVFGSLLGYIGRAICFVGSVIYYFAKLIEFWCSLEGIFKALDNMESFVVVMLEVPIHYICIVYYFLFKRDAIQVIFVYLLFGRIAIDEDKHKGGYVYNVYYHSFIWSGSLGENMQLLRIYWYAIFFVLSTGITQLDISGIYFILDNFMEKDFLLYMDGIGGNWTRGYGGGPSGTGTSGFNGSSGGAPDPGPNNGLGSSLVFSNEESRDSNHRTPRQTGEGPARIYMTRTEIMPMSTPQTLPPIQGHREIGMPMNTSRILPPIQGHRTMDVPMNTPRTLPPFQGDRITDTAMNTPRTLPPIQGNREMVKTESLQPIRSIPHIIPIIPKQSTGVMNAIQNARSISIAEISAWEGAYPSNPSADRTIYSNFGNTRAIAPVYIYPYNCDRVINGSFNQPCPVYTERCISNCEIENPISTGTDLPQGAVLRVEVTCKAIYLTIKDDSDGRLIHSLKRGQLADCPIDFFKPVHNDPLYRYGLNLNSVSDIKLGMVKSYTGNRKDHVHFVSTIPNILRPTEAVRTFDNRSVMHYTKPSIDILGIRLGYYEKHIAIHHKKYELV